MTRKAQARLSGKESAAMGMTGGAVREEVTVARLSPIHGVVHGAANERRISFLGASHELSNFDMGVHRVDISGWTLLAADSRPLGIVERLMVDLRTRQIRYVTVALVDSPPQANASLPLLEIMIPVGVIRRLDDRRAIALDTLTEAQLASAPVIPRDTPVSRALEDATLSSYGMATSADLPSGDLYALPIFDETRLYALPGR
jgi:hypothetical protein